MTAETGSVRLTRSGARATVWFDRPKAHNAMTESMYAELETHCASLASSPEIRVIVLRGQGGRAFVSGTDISRFLAFQRPEDGIAYEQRIDAVITAVEALPQPTVAVVEGWCMGGGLALASACDFRIAADNARFGVPIAKTVGNCLSINTTARLVASIGPVLAKRLLLGAEFVDAAQAAAIGFVSCAAAPGDDLEKAADELCARLETHAPLTMSAVKEAIRRLRDASLPDIDDLVLRCYGSRDFAEGVAAYLEKRPPRWSGT